jgi:anti-sigma B factor antagonist
MEKIHKEILGLMGKIDIDCRDEEGIIIIDLAGQLDIYNSNDVSLLVEAYRERGFNQFILNLEKVTYLDSSTISVFIHCYQMLKDEGWFVLAGLHGAPKEVFELAKLHDVFQIFPDVPTATTTQHQRDAGPSSRDILP